MAAIVDCLWMTAKVWVRDGCEIRVLVEMAVRVRFLGFCVFKVLTRFRDWA